MLGVSGSAVRNEPGRLSLNLTADPGHKDLLLSSGASSLTSPYNSFFFSLPSFPVSYIVPKLSFSCSTSKRNNEMPVLMCTTRLLTMKQRQLV